MKSWMIFIIAIGCITAISCVAMATGHDNQIITGAISAIVGITTGFAGYYYGKSKAVKEGQNGNKKAESGG